MAKTKRDALTRVVHFTVWMLVLAILCFGGFTLTKNYIEDQVTELNQQREEVNQERIDQHNQLVQESLQQQETAVEDDRWPEPAQEGWDVVDVSTFALTNSTSKSFTRSELLGGGLMLVNRWHTMPEDLTEDLMTNVGRDSAKSANPIPVSDYTVQLLPEAYNALYDMLAAAKDLGLENYLIEEGWRSNDTQTASFQKELSKYESKYSGDALIEQARKSVNVPGTSEYQTGLSFRISRWKKNDSEFNSAKFLETDHFTFLMEHGWEYGFVFRFPVSGYPYENTMDKAWKTGESKKLRVFRYVGKAAAAVMYHEDWCLEEFIEYMIDHPHIAVYENGNLRYELIRVADTGSDITTQVSARAANVTASIDNMGGVIVCMEY